MDELLGEVSLYRMIKMVLPATLNQIILANPRIHPDAIRERLRTYQKFGYIRDVHGLWCVVKEEEPLRPSEVTKPRLPCIVCGKKMDSDRLKFCSMSCRKKLPRPKNPCKHCGTPVKRNDRTYCGHVCAKLALSKKMGVLRRKAYLARTGR